MKHHQFALLAGMCLIISAPVLHGQPATEQRPEPLSKAHANIIALANLAMQRLDQGALEEAESLGRRVLLLLNENAGMDNAEYAVAEGNLASVLIAKARYIEADHLLDDALERMRRAVGTTDPRFVTLLEERAELRMEQGRFRESIEAMLKAVKIRGQRPWEAQQLAQSYQNLGVAYAADGKYARAIPYFHKAEQLWTNSLPAEDPVRLAGLNALLVVYTRTHQDQQADRLTPLILSQADACLKSQPLELALLLNNIGTMYAERDRDQQAAELFDRAYRIDLGMLGEFHPQTALARMNYGRAIQRLGRIEEGRSIETRAKAALSLVR
jgi:tetratricopeptide (TPR) repeat protein